MTKHRIHSRLSTQRGIVLVEGMIAILIFSIGILGIVGLQAAMAKSTGDAKYRAEASFIAQQRLSAIRVDLDNAANYMENENVITAESRLPNGTRTTLRNSPQCGVIDPFAFCVVVRWQLPGDDPHNVIAVARINPALDDPALGAGGGAGGGGGGGGGGGSSHGGGGL